MSARRIGVLSTLVFLLLVALGSSGAKAQRRYRYYRIVPEGKAGPVMLNFRGGPAFGVKHAEDDLRFLGAVGMDLGFAVSPDLNAYIVLTPNVMFRPHFANVQVPIGFQYDIRLARNFYLYPRGSLGYGALIFTTDYRWGPFRYYAQDVVHGGMFIPELGLKFVANGRLNIGFEPFSMPVFFNGDGYSVWYRFMFFIGGNLG